MVKKRLSKIKNKKGVDIEVESWQWETFSPPTSWKHWLAVITFLVAIILFAFGFLILAGFVILFVVFINIVSFFFKKLR